MRSFEKVCEIVADRHGLVTVEAAAKALQQNLTGILEGEAPYDIFVRWKDLAHQPVGWKPNLDDGVRLNIRPSCKACVLCKSAKRLNIIWEKNRGPDRSSSLWYPVFHDGCINDSSTTLAEKEKSREESK